MKASQRLSAPSTATDPLDRLGGNAIGLANAAFVAVKHVRDGGLDLGQHLEQSLRILAERLSDVGCHEGPEWLQLATVHSEPVACCGEVGESWVDVAALIGRTAYGAFLRVGDKDAYYQWLLAVKIDFSNLAVPPMPPEMATFDGYEPAPEPAQKYLAAVNADLAATGEIPIQTIAVAIAKEVRTAKEMMQSQVSILTSPMTVGEIAAALNIGRNIKPEQLAQLEAVPFGAKYRVPVKNMPPEWLAKKGISGVAMA